MAGVVESVSTFNSFLRTMLALEPAARRAVGASGRAHILSRFTWDRVADRLAEAYASVCPS